MVQANTIAMSDGKSNTRLCSRAQLIRAQVARRSAHCRLFEVCFTLTGLGFVTAIIVAPGMVTQLFIYTTEVCRYKRCDNNFIIRL